MMITTFDALAAELIYSARSARFEDVQMTAFDPSAQVRLMYAITSDGAFGGGE